MSHTIAVLRKLTDDQLIEQHDNLAKNTVVGTKYYQDELRSRSNDRLGQRMLWLTIANAVLAAAAVIVSIVALSMS